MCSEANCIVRSTYRFVHHITTRHLPILSSIGGLGGGLSEYIATDVHLPDGVARRLQIYSTSHLFTNCESAPWVFAVHLFDFGACTEPLAVAWYAVKRSGFEESQTTLIIGAGPVSDFFCPGLSSILIDHFFEIELFLLIVLSYFLSNAQSSFYSLLLTPFRSIDRSSNTFVSGPASRRRELAVTHGTTRVFDPAGFSGDSLCGSTECELQPWLRCRLCIWCGRGLDAGLMNLRPRGVFIM